jgi:hypothetical protein
MNLKTIGKLFGLGVALALLALAVGNSGQTGLSQEEFWTLDDMFARWADAVPGFGGLFLDEHGNLNIYLLDPYRYAGLARELIPGFLLHELGISIPGEIVFLQGQFDYRDLKEWADKAIDVLSLDGTVFFDIDEGLNRLSIGIEDAYMEHEVRGMLQALHIPQEAVIVEVTGPLELLSATLRDRVRPTIGGLQIQSKLEEKPKECTLGFNAYQGGELHFVTASHCTKVWGILEGTRFGQPTIDNPIGTEVKDPGFWEGRKPCPKGRACRFSDSALVKYDKDVEVDFPTIARIYQYCGYPEGSIEISGRFIVERKRPSPLKGDWVQKVGRTTGWTCGTVIRTNVAYNDPEWPVTLLSQNEAIGEVEGGDSGAPVFQLTRKERYGIEAVNLLGLVVAKRKDKEGTVMVFSSMFWIEAELGELDVSVIKGW